MQFLTCVSFRQSAAVVARGHDFAVGTCGEEGEEVATLCLGQWDVLVEDVGGLADGAYHIVGVRLGGGAGEVDNLVVRIIEGRADEVGETCIDDGELLDGILLHIENFGDEGTALTDDGAAEFEVNGLAGAQFEVLVIHGKVVLEVGDGVGFGLDIIDAKSSAHIHNLNLDAC